MIRRAFAGQAFYDALRAENFELPAECVDVRLVAPPDGLVQLHYVVNVTDDDMVRIGRALQRLGDPA